ncbi:hypothetical protein DFJ74DRAFT_696612 [Hyaloraphidium curvatum]|nr:hypothetical protein DFJ74DRAFT_696612 [Hyaloraphidium curvatum]
MAPRPLVSQTTLTTSSYTLPRDGLPPARAPSKTAAAPVLAQESWRPSLSELWTSLVETLTVIVEEYSGATSRVLDHLAPLSPSAKSALRRLAAAHSSAASASFSGSPSSTRSVSSVSLAPDDASFVTADEGDDHRVEWRVLLMAVLVRLGELSGNAVGWDAIEPHVPRLRLLASNPVVSYVLPPLVRSALLDELTRWSREIASRKDKREWRDEEPATSSWKA